MSRARTLHRCGDCGATAPQWAGQCPTCGAWNSLVEEPVAPVGRPVPAGAGEPALLVVDVPTEERRPHPTGVDEVDRVLGGGLVPGSVTVIGGAPGMGKSTLLLQVAAAVAATGRTALYSSSEESRVQVRARADRLGVPTDRLWLHGEASVDHLVQALDEQRPDLVVVDSVQTAFDPSTTSAPGSLNQVRAVAQRMVVEARARGCAVVLVGQVTKDGNLAGPKALEHVVDTVLAFEGDKHHALRLLRAVKHRYGATDELGVLEMTEGGLVGVPDPSGMFLAGRRPGVPGSVVVPTLDGHRPILVEVQALCAEVGYVPPRRSAQGIDGGRLALLLAVLETRVTVSTAKSEVYALTAGGVRLVEPAGDLGLALAVVSSANGVPLPEDAVAVGEVGLGGEVRPVGRIEHRLTEAARLGFRQAVVPRGTPPVPGIRLIEVGTVLEATAAVGLLDERKAAA
ncbi:MAG TPA: DNA repair protein RadA [Acidimicrobiales bacterium]|nr:DNA repair protein RadA [Acidimicrobiales bacterium]